jgi:hypothetical protein
MAIGDSYHSPDAHGIGSRKGPIHSISSDKGKRQENDIQAPSTITDIEHVETVKKITEVGRFKRARQGTLRHFKRFWICYGLAGFVFLAIFLPVL